MLIGDIWLHDFLLFIKLINGQYDLDVSENSKVNENEIRQGHKISLSEKTDLLNAMKIFGPGQRFSIL